MTQTKILDLHTLILISYLLDHNSKHEGSSREEGGAKVSKSSW